MYKHNTLLRQQIPKKIISSMEDGKTCAKQPAELEKKKKEEHLRNKKQNIKNEKRMKKKTIVKM